MLDGQTAEKTFSDRDEDDRHAPVGPDSEQRPVDDDVDLDTRAFRDAMHDIWASEGRFEVLLP